MPTVDIYLPIESTTEWIHALSIPRRDIERLTLRPLKWLRFATFTVCGAKGHLSTTKGGQTVDYENVSFENLTDRYYYTPDNNVYHLVDYEAFNDTCTSSAATRRSYNFRERVCTRDDKCVITRRDRAYCDAAHIIPRSKGKNYISSVVHDRSSLYEQLPVSLSKKSISTASRMEYFCAQTYIRSLAKLTLYSSRLLTSRWNPTMFRGLSNILCQITERRYNIWWNHQPRNAVLFYNGTFKLIGMMKYHPRLASCLTSCTGLRSFTTGSALVCGRCQRNGLEISSSQSWLKFQNLPPPEDDEFEERDDPKDLDYDPSKGKQKGKGKGKGKGRKRFSSDASAGLLEAMDDVLLLSMLLKGTTPQSVAAEWERRHKEEELRSQEQSREKVQQWLNLSATPLNSVEKDC